MGGGTGPGFALVHSPFLGPDSWAPVAARLLAAGQATWALDLTGALAAADPYAAVGRAVAARLDGPTILAVHSGAGALVPSIVQATAGQVVGAIFVDALTPHPGRAWFDTAPAGLAEAIRRGARDGYAPPWSSLVPASLLEALLPSGEQRDRFVGSCPRVPITYLEMSAPIVDGLPAGRCGYLRLSAGYDEDARGAEARGWRVERMDGDHLSVLTRPAEVAAAMVRLASGLGAPQARNSGGAG